MPSWILKASIQGVISLLPYSQRINYLFQRYASKGLKLSEAYFEEKLHVCHQHIDNYQAVKDSDSALPANVLELGTGWLPIIPIALFLCGIDEVISVDVNPLLRLNLIQETVDFFIRYTEEKRLEEHLPVQANRTDALYAAREALRQGDIPRAFEQLHITSLVADARSLPYEDQTFDFYVSNNTFEHIPPQILEEILAEYHRTAKSDAVMSHLTDLSDHYWQFDKHLNPYYFLRFSPSVWSIFNNPLQYQNRLRVSDYRAIHHKTNFNIVQESNATGSEADIAAIQLASEFKHYHHDDLIVITNWMISIKLYP